LPDDVVLIFFRQGIRRWKADPPPIRVFTNRKILVSHSDVASVRKTRLKVQGKEKSSCLDALIVEESSQLLGIITQKATEPEDRVATGVNREGLKGV
jgi:hypothetical protein